MIEIKQDLFSVDLKKNDCIVITTNNVLNSRGELVMGAGIAKKAKEKWPKLPSVFGEELALNKLCNIDEYNIMFANTSMEGPSKIGLKGPFILALQTKFHWKEPSDLDLIVRSCKAMLKHGGAFEKVYMSRPGCGNGGLKWENVRPAISFLDDRFLVCHNDNK